MTVAVLRAPATKWDHWGDYGDMLVHGMSRHQPRKDHLLQLERTGPYLPPITFPGISDVIVDEPTRKALMQRVPALAFRPVIMKRIVRIDWHEWDASREQPPKIPYSGEPEDYILRGKHDAQLAQDLGTLWELAAEVDSAIQGREGVFNAQAYRGQHLVRATEMAGRNFISSDMRGALEAVCAEWVSFEPVKAA